MNRGERLAWALLTFALAGTGLCALILDHYILANIMAIATMIPILVKQIAR